MSDYTIQRVAHNKRGDLLMRTIKKLNPGKAGTKKLVKKYGDQLICVRYRIDDEKKRRIKTVELIEKDVLLKCHKDKIPMNKKVYIRVQYNEFDLRSQVKIVGGRWNKEKRLWEMPYRQVLELGITDRIVEQM